MADTSDNVPSNPLTSGPDMFYAPDHSWSKGVEHAVRDAKAAFPDNGPYATDRVKYLIDATNLLNARQSFEAGWVGQRMSWLVISQSFLFSAFATAAQRDLPILIVLKWLVPIMGLVQAVATRISITSASQVDSDLYKTRTLLDVGLRLFAPGFYRLPPLGDVRVGRLAHSRWRGALSSRLIPSTLVAAWVIVIAVLMVIHVAPQTMDHLLGLPTPADESRASTGVRR